MHRGASWHLSIGYPEWGFIIYTRLRLPSGCGPELPKKTAWKSRGLEGGWSLLDRYLQFCILTSALGPTPGNLPA
jgi:hypothetical protein